MSATSVDPSLVRAVLEEKIVIAPLETGDEERLLKNMLICGIRRYGDLVLQNPLHVQVLVGREAFEQFCSQLEILQENNLPIAFNMNVETYGWQR